MSCPYGRSDAAYVLGALSPAERANFQAHLADCADCADAVAELAPIPGLLRRVDPELLPPPEPEPDHLAGLLTEAASRRRRQARVRRWQTVGVAVAAALLAAAGTAVVVAGLPEPAADQSADRPTVAMRPVVTGVPLTVRVATEPGPGGTEVHMACRYPDSDYQAEPRAYRLVAVSADGTADPIGSWWAQPGDEVTLTTLTHLTDDLDRLELRDAADTALLAYDVR